MSSEVDGFIKVGTMQQLRIKRCIVAQGAEVPIAVFYHDGKVDAVHNRCPHSGYPLETGTIKDGVITCIWHQARFELATGCSLNMGLVDVPTFEVKVVDNEVWVSPTPMSPAKS